MEKSEFRILVAEDDAIVRDVIDRFLTQEGYSVVAAEDGLTALKLLRVEDIKLVLTDLRMPGADGMEVLRTAVRMNPRISVVLLTAYGTLDTALEAMKEGAYDYIVKPFVMQQLLLVVRNAFRLASLIMENERLSDQLRETYRELETLRNSGGGNGENISTVSADRTGESGRSGRNDKEAGMLKGRTGSSDDEADPLQNENIKKFSSLVKDLKNVEKRNE